MGLAAQGILDVRSVQFLWPPIALGAIGGVGVAVRRITGLVVHSFGISFWPSSFQVWRSVCAGSHDTGKSGWLVLVFFLVGPDPFIGIIGAIIQIVFMCQGSDPGTNQYGPNPSFRAGFGCLYGSAGFFTSMGLPLGAQPQPAHGREQLRVLPRLRHKAEGCVPVFAAIAEGA